MKFSIARDFLLKPLTLVAGAIERRQTLPILSNVLMEIKDNELILTGTDLEVELKGHASCESIESGGAITVPARKLLDICRALPEETLMEFSHDQQRLSLKCGRARFNIATLPAEDFPNIDESVAQIEFSMSARDLSRLLNQVHFSMALQDVRYFLNGVLLELNGQGMRVVATDGHRLAISQTIMLETALQSSNFIIPRKGVQEIMRLFPSDLEETLAISFSSHFLSIKSEHYSLISKLIDGRYPNYDKVIPKQNNSYLLVSKDNLLQALNCAAIFTNDKYKGVKIQVRPQLIQVLTKSPEHEEAADQEIGLIEHQGGELDIVFNVSYLLDALGAIESENVRFNYSNPEAGAILENAEDVGARYIVMPMLL